MSPWCDVTASTTNRADASVGFLSVTEVSGTKEPPSALLGHAWACGMLCSLLGEQG